jgi:rRNA maturation endonuclease Nob1
MIAAVSILLLAGVLAFVLWVRPQDLPEATPPSPTQHLDERKAAIYENLRDLNFEYRLGKLSDGDYQKTKVGLQQELAKVMAAIDEVVKGVGGVAKKAAVPVAATAGAKVKVKTFVCPHCGAAFEKAMKYCGECGKPMEAEG